VAFTAVDGRGMHSCRLHLAEVDRLLLSLVVAAALAMLKKRRCGRCGREKLQVHWAVVAGLYVCAPCLRKSLWSRC
jgi:late competence protein required for DNA uptake (superfamily II DNA/RNA helicase)